MSDETPVPVWQLRLFSTLPAETHELHVEIQAATADEATSRIRTLLVGSSWFIDEGLVRKKTGPRRYTVEERVMPRYV
jgi:hypothetical protein